MDGDRYETFEEFWDYYVGEHKHPTTRILHFVGSTLAAGCVAGALFTRRRWLILLAPILGYGPSWIGHFFIEKNKPATFKYPLWSLAADYVMIWKMIRGEMQAEVDRVIRQQEEKAKGAATETAATPASTPAEVMN